mmetsp:Transcript_12906/g.33045  ORF Transcript_12906/g.33045 Transcript_12906/m.33045 type:complete len:179 (+) Transcript_12906:156-692(+)
MTAATLGSVTGRGGRRGLPTIRVRALTSLAALGLFGAGLRPAATVTAAPMARTTSTAHVVQPPLPPEASAPHFLLYNRIPKAGSTTLIALFRELSKRRTAGGAAGGYPGQQFKVTNAPREHYYPDEPFATESEDAETWEYLVELASAANASVGHLFINHMFRPDFAVSAPTAIQIHMH